MRAGQSLRAIQELKPGDVILCYCDPDSDFICNRIYRATESKYCHAAIYYGNSLAAESVAKNGLKKGEIEKSNIADLVARYDHVAVLRQPDAWSSSDRVNALQLFIDKVVENQSKYNFRGVFTFVSRKEFHLSTVHDKLTAYFEGDAVSAAPEKSKYFCSEFVADCFIAVGFIAPSASVLFQSDTFSPGDLAKEPTFGTFWGYLSASPEYTIPDDDHYYHANTYDEIFGV